MDDRTPPRRRMPGGDVRAEPPTMPGSVPPPMAPSAAGGPPPMEPPTGGRPQAPGRATAYQRPAPPWRRIAAIILGVVCMALVALWLDWPRALAVWVLFSLFVVAWPMHPTLTPAEERARAWPFEP